MGHQERRARADGRAQSFDYSLVTTEEKPGCFSEAIDLCAQEVEIDQAWLDGVTGLVTAIGRYTGKKREAMQPELLSELKTAFEYFLALSLTCQCVENEGHKLRDSSWLIKRYERFTDERLESGAELLRSREMKALVRISSSDMANVNLVAQGFLINNFNLVEKLRGRLGLFERPDEEIKVDAKKAEAARVQKKRKKRRRRGEARRKAKKRKIEVQSYITLVDYALEMGYRFSLAMVMLEEDFDDQAVEWALGFWSARHLRNDQLIDPSTASIAVQLADDGHQSRELVDQRLMRASSIQYTQAFLESVKPETKQPASLKNGVSIGSFSRLPGTLKDVEEHRQRVKLVHSMPLNFKGWQREYRNFRLFKKPYRVILHSVEENDLANRVTEMVLIGAHGFAKEHGFGFLKMPLWPGFQSSCLYRSPESIDALRQELRAFVNDGLSGQVEGNDHYKSHQLKAEHLESILSLIGPDYLIGKYLEAFHDGFNQSVELSDAIRACFAGDVRVRDDKKRIVQESNAALAVKVNINIADDYNQSTWGMTRMKFEPLDGSDLKVRINFGDFYFDFTIVHHHEEGLVSDGLNHMKDCYRVFVEKVVFAYLAYLLEPTYKQRMTGRGEPRVICSTDEVVDAADQRKGYIITPKAKVALDSGTARGLLFGPVHFMSLPIGYKPDRDRFTDTDIIGSVKLVFGPHIDMVEINQRLIAAQEDLTSWLRLPSLVRDKVGGRLKAIMIKEERARFCLCQVGNKQVIRLCLLEPNKVFSKDDILGLGSQAKQPVRVLRMVSMRDFAPDEVLAGCYAAEDLIRFQQELEQEQHYTKEDINIADGLPVCHKTICLYQTTVRVIKKKREDIKVVQVTCPNVLKELKAPTQ